MKLEPLLNPETIAVIGASRSPGKVGHEILANLVKGEFPGTIVPVNPAAREVLGLPCYKDLKEYGKSIDLGIVAVVPAQVRAAVESALEAGAWAVAVITSGFKELGPEGARLESDLVKLCSERGSRLLGPNCLGVINTHKRMNASFARTMPPTGGISVVSQSGALIAAILDWALGKGLGFAKVVSIGNKADLTEIDFLRAFAQDPETRVIVGYLESIASGDAFIRAAEAASTHKPVVIYKAGVTPGGFRAVSAHTGGLAGEDLAYGAAFKRSGVIRADTFEALFDYATALAMQPLPVGNRVAVLTNAGGPGVMAADTVERLGMRLAALSAETTELLRAALPQAASVINPVDVMGDAQPERYAAALDALQADPGVDAALVILTPQAMTLPVETARALGSAKGERIPVLVSFMGGEEVAAGRRELVALDLPDYSSPERAAAALKAMVDLAAWRTRPPRVVTRFPANRRRVERIIRRHIRTGRLLMGELAAKDVMAAYGFSVPAGHLAGGLEEAIDAAEKVGYPVVLKPASPELPFRAVAEAARSGIASPAALRDAYDLILLRVPRDYPEVRLDGVYVERMALTGSEVVIGMTRDPQFGPMLMFGLGGISVEVMADVAFHLAPVTADEALEMLKSTRSYALLAREGVREAVDLDSIAAGLQRISQLATDFPQILELEINPFQVGASGQEPLVAGARITLSEQLGLDQGGGPRRLRG